MLFHALVEGVDQRLRQILCKGPLAGRDDDVNRHTGNDTTLDFRGNVLVVDAHQCLIIGLAVRAGFRLDNILAENGDFAINRRRGLGREELFSACHGQCRLTVRIPLSGTVKSFSVDNRMPSSRMRRGSSRRSSSCAIYISYDRQGRRRPKLTGSISSGVEMNFLTE